MFNSSASYSPPSSPCAFPDSSPPSSPGSSVDIDFDLSNSPSLVHPFSGSTKQVKKPRIYEKRQQKRSISYESEGEYVPSTDLAKKKVRYSLERPPSPSDFRMDELNVGRRPEGDLFTARTRSPEERFQELVDRACIDTSLHITFESQGLSYIPERAIEDLQKIVILPTPSELKYVTSDFKALHTASNAQNPHAPPSHARRRSLNFVRASSALTLSGVPREQMSLVLADNYLRSLPPQLFHLTRLTVLSLRANNLTFVPPEIRFLSSLNELNIAGNQLTYLPAEMLDMKLTTLGLHPNPFLPPPPRTNSTRTFSRSTTSKTRLFQAERPKIVSPIKCIDEDGIPSLFELCLRMLFSFSSSETSSPTTSARAENVVLSYYDEIPAFMTEQLPPTIMHLLQYSIPGKVKGYPTDSLHRHKQGEITGVGVCRSPRHTQTHMSTGSALPCGSGLFFQHVEERFTWESVIAGVENLGEVPVRWRGCERGCLEFLSDRGPKSNEANGQPGNTGEQGLRSTASAAASEVPTASATFTTTTSSATVATEVVNLEDVLQPIRTAESFTEEEFDDHA